MSLVLTAKVGNNSDLFPDVLSLYAKNNDRILDMTYGLGVFWRNIDCSKYKLIKNDIDLSRGDIHSDFRDVPFNTNEFDIIVFDPPYGNNSSNKGGFLGSIYNNSDAGTDTVSSMINLYLQGIVEAKRVLKIGGYLMVKCMDEISGGKQKRNHITIWEETLKLGFIDEDLFVLVQNRTPLMRHAYQLHARKNNSFLWVFKNAQ